MRIKPANGGEISSAFQARAEAARQEAAQAAARAARTATRPSGFEPRTAPNAVNLEGGSAPASSLLTEDTRDGCAHGLRRAADFLARSTPQLQARSELVFLRDQREGQTGHVVVRQGERVLDPRSGRSHEDLRAYLREQPQYREVGTLPGITAAKVLATGPESPERVQALAKAHVSPELRQMMGADAPPSAPDELPDPTQPEDVSVSTGGAGVGPVTVNYPDQPGPVRVEFSASLDSEVEREDGYVTVTMTAETSVSATGELELEAVTVGGGVSAGTQMTYEVRMTEEDYARMLSGEIPPPHPLDPRTLPDGASVRLEQSQFTGTSLEAGISYHAVELGMSSDIREGEGMMIEMTRTGDSVQVTAGPLEFIENEGEIRIGAGPVAVSAGRTDTLTNYQLRTATFDLSDPEGQRACDTFLQTGRLPEQPGPGVRDTLHLEQVIYESQPQFGVELGAIELSGGGEGTLGDMLITHHPDGSTTRSLNVEYGDDHPHLNITQRFDANGQPIPGSESYTFEFDTDDPNMRELLVLTYTGDQAQAEAARDGDAPITITLTQAEMLRLQERAQERGPDGRDFNALLNQDGEPLDPLQAARQLASAPNFNAFTIVQELLALSNDGEDPPPGTLDTGG